MMKLYIKRYLILLLTVLNLCLPVRAAVYEYNGTDHKDWESAWGELLEALPEEIRNEVSGYAISPDMEEQMDLQKVLSLSYWWDKLVPVVRETLQNALQNLTAVCAMLLLTAILRQWNGQSTGSIFMFCSDVCLALTLMEAMGALLLRMQVFLERLCTVMTAMIPVMTAVHFGTGEVTTASVNRIALTLFITVLTQFQRGLFLPLGQALCSISIMNGVCTQISIGGFVNGVKKLFMTLLSLLLLVYSFVYGIQNLLAKSADSLGMRTVRFAVGNMIPIVGGTVAEAFSAVRAGMGYVKLMAGAGGIWILALLILPTAVSIWTFDLMLSCSHTAAELMDCGQSARLLGDARSILQMLSAVIWLCIVFFLFAIILFTKNAGQVS